MHKIVRVAGIAVALLVLVGIAVPLLVDANAFRPRLQSELTKALGREVTVGNLKLAILSGGVTADDLSIADDPDFSKSSFVRAKSLNVQVELWPLVFSRKLHVTGITIDQPDIVLLQSAPGDWNFSRLGAGSPANTAARGGSDTAGVDLSVKLVKIADGRLSVGKTGAHSKPLVLEKVNLELRDFSAASVMPFSLTAKVAGGGDVKLDGKAGPIHSDDTVLTPVDAHLRVADLDLERSGLMDPASGIGGVVSIQGNGVSNGRTLEVTGRVKADRLKLARGGSPARRPVDLDFAVDHDLLKGSGSVKRGDIHIGAAEARLLGTYARRGDSVVLNANLSGPSMPIQELEAMLPALNIVLPAGTSLQGGTASAKMNVEGPIDRLAANGSLGLSNTRLTGFDLGSKMAVIETLAGIKGGPNTEIQTLSANVRTGEAGTRIDDIKLIAPAIGELAGGGAINPEHALDFKMRATLYTPGGVMASLGKQASIPFLVRGTSSSPAFQPDVRGMATQQLNNLKGDASKAATGILGNLLGKKKN